MEREGNSFKMLIIQMRDGAQLYLPAIDVIKVINTALLVRWSHCSGKGRPWFIYFVQLGYVIRSANIIGFSRPVRM